MKAREDQIRKARAMAGSHLQSWKDDLNRIKQLVQKPARVGAAQAEKLVTCSSDNGRSNDAATSPCELVFVAGNRPPSV